MVVVFLGCCSDIYTPNEKEPLALDYSGLDERKEQTGCLLQVWVVAGHMGSQIVTRLVLDGLELTM